MEDAEVRVITEQLGRMVDTLNAKITRLEESLNHYRELEDERIRGMKDKLGSVEEGLKDHEQRIRSATDGVTSFKTWAGLGAGGSTVISIIAFIKSIIP